MNMILHGVHYSKFDIRLEDTLEHPQHSKLDAEAVVANPPFSAKWSANQLFMTDDRFSEYGRLAPSSKADFAFIQHMIYHLAENGIMAVVMPHGVLFRGAAEGHIRKYLIEEKNYLDAVIGLPANIFFGTSIPTCILVFKKCRENPDNVLFINAAEYYERGTQNLLRDEDVDRIVSTYQERREIEKFSSLATLEFIAENEYNLNIPRYVDTFEEQELVNISEVSNQLKSLVDQMKNTDEELVSFCNELKIDTPF
jgi:type I restriction enzyme M protein